MTGGGPRARQGVRARSYSVPIPPHTAAQALIPGVLIVHLQCQVFSLPVHVCACARCGARAVPRRIAPTVLHRTTTLCHDLSHIPCASACMPQYRPNTTWVDHCSGLLCLYSPCFGAHGCVVFLALLRSPRRTGKGGNKRCSCVPPPPNGSQDNEPEARFRPGHSLCDQATVACTYAET